MTLIFVDPIVHDAFSYAEKLRQESVQGDLGIKKWQIWIQEGPGTRQFSIQRIECQEPNAFIKAFKDQMHQKNSYAYRLNKIFEEHLSTNHYLIQPSGKIADVLDLPINPQNASLGYDLCYILPLLPGKNGEHREYCRSAMNEKREQTINACLAFGMIDLKKWIQESSQGDFVLYCQKMSIPIDQARQEFVLLKNNLKVLQATQTLRDQTGVTFEELFPKVTCISLFE